jgi:hypothetical protein
MEQKNKENLGALGLEPKTTRLKARCSTFELYTLYLQSLLFKSRITEQNWEQEWIGLSWEQEWIGLSWEQEWIGLSWENT